MTINDPNGFFQDLPDLNAGKKNLKRKGRNIFMSKADRVELAAKKLEYKAKKARESYDKLMIDAEKVRIKAAEKEKRRLAALQAVADINAQANPPQAYRNPVVNPPAQIGINYGEEGPAAPMQS